MLTLDRGRETRFREAIIDALIIYLLNAYPRVVWLFRSFGPVAESLMLGKGFSSSRKVADEILDEFARPDIHFRCLPRNLHVFDPKSTSAHAASDFIFSQRKNQQVGAAGNFDSTLNGEPTDYVNS